MKVGYERIAFNNMARCEAHDKYEFYLLTEGDRYLFVKDAFYHLKAGDAFLLAPDTEHRTLDAGGGYARLLINLPAVHFPAGAEPDCELFIARPEGELGERVAEQVRRLIGRIEREDAGLGTYAAVLELLDTVLSCENIASRSTVATPTLDRVADILKYISYTP